MEVPRIKRLQETRYGLVGDHCFVCHKPTFPPKDICSDCTTGELLKLRKMSGTIYDSSKNTTSNTQGQVGQVQG